MGVYRRKLKKGTRWRFVGSYLGERYSSRAGYAEDGGSLAQKSVSAGVGYQPVPKGDLLGFGLNWSESNETTFGPGLDDQYTAELFYRWQLAPQLAITPDVQLIIDPALNPQESSIWVFSLRARLAL